MPWRDACTPYFDGGWSGIPPWGDGRGDGENARGVTAIRQVAGAHLAYRFLPAIDTEPKGKIIKTSKYKGSGWLVGLEH